MPDLIRGLRQRHGAVVLVALCLVLALAFALRLHYAIDRAPQTPDARGYSLIAERLYEKGSFGGPGDFHDDALQEPTNYSPGLPLFVAGLYYVTGGVHLEMARIVIAILGTLACLLAYLITRRLVVAAIGERKRSDLIEGVAGVGAALAVAVYLPLRIYNGMLMTEPLAAFTVAAAALAFLWASDPDNTIAAPSAPDQPGASPTGDAQPRLWAWTIPGLLMGMTAMVRPEYLVFGFAFALLALLRVRRATSWKPGLKAAALLLLAFLLPIVPWTIRNLVVLDRFVPLSTGGGKALFIGTYLPAGGINPALKPVLLKAPIAQPYIRRVRIHNPHKNVFLDGILAAIARRKYPNLTPDEALGRLGRQNLRRYLGAYPLDYLDMLRHKVWYMWRKGALKQMRHGGWLFFHRALVVLGLVGLVVLAWRRRWEALVIGTLILGVTAISALLLSHPRRALPLIPLVSALAAAALVWIAVQVTDRARARS